jgi:hypothetical protein
MLSIAVSAQQLEVDLAAGRVACPDCRGPLARWGCARSRVVRMRDGARSLRPRRGRCHGCGRTHVLCPSWSVPCRRDGAEVIGEALRLAAGGEGHRRIARRLERAPGTVRGWLRAARANAESLQACATRWVVSLDPEPAGITPAGSELGNAVEAVMIAVRAWVLRFGPGPVGPWERAVWLTGGLLTGRPVVPP